MANTPLNFLLAYTSFTSLISNPQNNNIILPRSVQLVARKNTPKNHRTSFRTEVEFPRSVQLVARNRQSRTEVEFPRSVQLVARNKNAHKGNLSCIKMHATIWNNLFWWRAFPNACLLYQSVIGTGCEACAIKSEIKSPIIDYRAFLRDILMNSVCRTIIISLSRGNLESECKA